jgi:hypothetical protein
VILSLTRVLTCSQRSVYRCQDEVPAHRHGFGGAWHCPQSSQSSQKVSTANGVTISATQYRLLSQL